MKTFILQIILALLIISSSGCKNHKIKSNEETQVINEIFKELTDSLVYYRAYPPPPPPPLPSSIDTSGNILNDSFSTKKYMELISKIDTSRFVLSLRDSARIDVDFKDRVNEFLYDSAYSDYQAAFKSYLKNDKKKSDLDIAAMRNTGRYELVKSSNIIGLENNTNNPKYDFMYYGEMTISSLFFNDSHTTGFFTCEVFCWRGCNYSYLILIKKVSMTWKIQKMIRLSIA